MNITTKLANALRALLYHTTPGSLASAILESTTVLAEYDAQDTGPQWTEEDQDAATAQGWLVSHVHGSKGEFDDVQRHDESEAFEGDENAIAYVYWAAIVGDELARRAMAYVLRPGNIAPSTYAPKHPSEKVRETKPMPRAVIIVRGGVVTGVCASDPTLSVAVLDYDDLIDWDDESDVAADREDRYALEEELATLHAVY